MKGQGPVLTITKFRDIKILSIDFNISGAKNSVCYAILFTEFEYVEVSIVVKVMGARLSVLIQLLRIFSFRFLQRRPNKRPPPPA